MSEPLLNEKYEMTLKDVLSFLELCESNRIDVFIDGGWGVDALLGRQTRAHKDLDIALRHRDAPKLRSLLESLGYKDVLRNDTTEYNFVLGDNEGHLIDFHTFELNDDGSNKLGVAYIASHLTGKGMIGGRAVKTIDPEWMVTFHTWYDPDEDDYHDVRLLCDKYDIPLPEKYKKFAL